MIQVSMVLGIGLDIVGISRLRRAVEKRGRRFLKKIFTPRELAACKKKKTGYWASLAARWAAKEAVYKACGDFWSGPAPYNQVEVFSKASGKPAVRLLSGARKALPPRRGLKVEISLSHEKDIAAAVAILIGE